MLMFYITQGDKVPTDKVALEDWWTTFQWYANIDQAYPHERVVRAPIHEPEPTNIELSFGTEQQLTVQYEQLEHEDQSLSDNEVAQCLATPVQVIEQVRENASESPYEITSKVMAIMSKTYCTNEANAPEILDNMLPRNARSKKKTKWKILPLGNLPTNQQSYSVKAQPVTPVKHPPERVIWVRTEAHEAMCARKPKMKVLAKSGTAECIKGVPLYQEERVSTTYPIERTWRSVVISATRNTDLPRPPE